MFVCLQAAQRLPGAIARKVQGVGALLPSRAKCSVWRRSSLRPAVMTSPAVFLSC
mgnify:CR=1 FL=1